MATQYIWLFVPYIVGNKLNYYYFYAFKKPMETTTNKLD